MSRKILFYGDSNTWGYRPGGGRLPANRRYTTMVTRQALDVVPLVDGLNGRCSAWESAVFPAELLGGAGLVAALKQAGAPDGLVIMLGTNDVMPPLNLAPAAVADNIRRMVCAARAQCADLTITIVSPPPLGTQAVEDSAAEGGDRTFLAADLAEVLDAVAAEVGVFFLSGSSIVPCMDAEDGYHLADVGHLRLGLALGSLLRSIGPRR